jgi:hypothetical protein
MLSYKQQRFVNEYCVDGNATNAYIRAGYAEQGAGQAAHKLLKSAEIQIAIEDQKDAMAAAASVTVELIVRELLRVATADQRAGCRHCWGIDHKYQWTEREYGKALDAALTGSGSVPDLLGGFGYIKSRKPHPECSECHGEGVPASSYDVKPAEKMKALDMLGRYKNMIVERKELSGPGGSPLQLQAAASPRELTDAELMTLASAAPTLLLEAENL